MTFGHSKDSRELLCGKYDSSVCVMKEVPFMTCQKYG